MLKEAVLLTSESETVKPLARLPSNVTIPFLFSCTSGMVVDKLSSLEKVFVAKVVIELLALLLMSES